MIASAGRLPHDLQIVRVVDHPEIERIREARVIVRFIVGLDVPHKAARGNGIIRLIRREEVGRMSEIIVTAIQKHEHRSAIQIHAET